MVKRMINRMWQIPEMTLIQMQGVLACRNDCHNMRILGMPLHHIALHTWAHLYTTCGTLAPAYPYGREHARPLHPYTTFSTQHATPIHHTTSQNIPCHTITPHTLPSRSSPFCPAK